MPFVPLASADEVVYAGNLPSYRFHTSAVWDGTHAYVFGGDGEQTFSDIVRYDPVSETSSVVGHLPTPILFTSAVWTGSSAFILGGDTGSGPSRDIRGYDPTTGDSWVQGPLPSPRFDTSAIWTGTYIFVFGGMTSAGGIDEIVRIDPERSPSAIVVGHLPAKRWGSSAVWDGNYAYIFGGLTGGGTQSDEILRYDVNWNSVAAMGARLPSPRSGTAAFWDGHHAFVVGGLEGSSTPRQIVRYNTTSDTAVVMSAGLERAHMGAVWDGREGIVLGGYVEFVGIVAEINKYRLAPGAPPRTWARGGPTPTAITVQWEPPAENTYSVLTGYRLYRAEQSGGPYTRVAELGLEERYVDEGHPAGVPRYYRVSAVNDGRDEGAMSAEVVGVAGTPPHRPGGLTARPGLAPGEVHLAWQAPAASTIPVTGYRIFRYLANASESPRADTGLAPTYLDRHAAAGRSYYYKVAAFNDAGEGPRSNATAMVGTEPPKVLVASDGRTTVYYDENGNDAVDGGEEALTTPASRPTCIAAAKNTTCTLAHYDNTTLLQAQPLPPVGTRIATLTVRDQGVGQAAALCVDLAPQGQPPTNLACVARALLGPADPLIPRGVTPLVAPGVFGNTTNATLTMDVTYTFEPKRVSFLASVAQGGFSLNTPILLTVEDAKWLAKSGHEVPLNVTAFAFRDGLEVANASLSIPYLGQILAAIQTESAADGPPTPPQRLVAVPSADPREVNLVWAEPSSDGGSPVTGYNVYRGFDSGAETLYATLDTSTEFTDLDCPSGAVCFYQVSALNAVGEGQRSNEAAGLGAAARCVRDALTTCTLAQRRDVEVAPSVLLPPEGRAIANVTIYDDGAGVNGRLCVDVQPEGQEATNVACVSRLLLGAADALIPRGTNSLLAAGALGATPNVTLDVDVNYTYDPGHVFFLTSLEGVGTYLPFVPTPEDAQWFLTNGGALALTVSVKVTGMPVDPLVVEAPWAGQVVAAAMATSGVPP